MSTPAPVPPKTSNLIILAPQDGDVCGPSFTVGGSIEAADGTTVTATVAPGSDSQSASVTDQGWETGSFTRSEGSYSASATSGTLSSGAVNFTVSSQPGIRIGPGVVIEDELPPKAATPGAQPPKKKVTVTVHHTSTLSPAVSAVLIQGRTIVHAAADETHPIGQGWRLVFRNVEWGVYAVRVTRHINDQRLSTSKLIRVHKDG